MNVDVKTETAIRGEIISRQVTTNQIISTDGTPIG